MGLGDALTLHNIVTANAATTVSGEIGAPGQPNDKEVCGPKPAWQHGLHGKTWSSRELEMALLTNPTNLGAIAYKHLHCGCF
jgi:hypothetical protein